MTKHKPALFIARVPCPALGDIFEEVGIYLSFLNFNDQVNYRLMRRSVETVGKAPDDIIWGILRGRKQPLMMEKFATELPAGSMSYNGRLPRAGVKGYLKTKREADDKALYDAFTVVGADKEGCDVEYAFAAQAEAVLQEEPV